MKTMSGIPSGIVPKPPSGIEHREHMAPAPAAAESPAPSPPAPEVSPETLEAAVAALQEELDKLPGGEREVHLRYVQEDLSFSVEIRDKESGELLQTFPPENLLNQGRSPADLLGKVIDRRS